jgi:hypothetical protein
MSASNPSLESTIQHLKEVRLQLLRLHKALLDSERNIYEQLHGRIPSTGEFLRLVLADEWFSWLRPISQLIALIDEKLSAKEPITLDTAIELLQSAHNLLQPAEEGTALQMRYHQAIQRDVDIAFFHAKISSLFMSQNN